jgi:hypothetical protein
VGPVSKMTSKQKAVCSILRCPDLWLQCNVSFVHGLKNIIFLCGASFLGRRNEFLSTFETVPFFYVCPVWYDNNDAANNWMWTVLQKDREDKRQPERKFKSAIHDNAATLFGL